MITKVYFPRLLLPAATALSGLLDFGIGSAFMVALMVYYRVKPGWTLLLWPLAVVALVMVTLGIGMLLAALNVRYRDVKHVIPFVVQLGLFVTPVIYPTTFLPARLRPWLVLNPLSGIVEGFRACIFPQQALDLRLLVGSVCVTLGVFVAGMIYFRKAERTFADII